MVGDRLKTEIVIFAKAWMSGYLGTISRELPVVICVHFSEKLESQTAWLLTIQAGLKSCLGQVASESSIVLLI